MGRKVVNVRIGGGGGGESGGGGREGAIMLRGRCVGTAPSARSTMNTFAARTCVCTRCLCA